MCSRNDTIKHPVILFWILPIFIAMCFLCILSVCFEKEDKKTETAIPTETILKATASPTVIIEDNRNLRMNVVENKGSQGVYFSPEELGGNFENHLVYVEISSASIEVDGTSYYLQDAIRDGVISAEEIFAYARMDARMGYCKEEWRTYHSLTHFIYRYPKFDLRIAYDIYKTPDGKEHLINELYVCENAYRFATRYRDIDREDWGLSFEVVDTTPTTVTVDCTQSGGQQLGTLVTDTYWIYTLDDEGKTGEIRHFDNITSNDQWHSAFSIPRGTTRITLDWTNIYGELPKGDYTMHLSVNDEFDPANVHPLMEDFQNRLDYWIAFTIS